MECDLTRIAPVTKEKSPQLKKAYWKYPEASVYINAINDEWWCTRVLKNLPISNVEISTTSLRDWPWRSHVGLCFFKRRFCFKFFSQRVLSFFIQHSLPSPSLGHKGKLHGGTVVFSTFPGFGVVLCVVVTVCCFTHTVCCMYCLCDRYGAVKKNFPLG